MADQDIRAQIIEVLSDPMNLPSSFWAYATENWLKDAPVFPASQLYGGNTGTIGTPLVFAGSPALSGVPTAPTAAANTNTTQIATTAFALAQDAAKANIASPTFTGIPAAPTPARHDNSTTLATTAYVDRKFIVGGVTAVGGVSFGSGFSVTKNGTGLYTINFTVAFTNVPVLIPVSLAGNLYGWVNGAPSVSSGQVAIENTLSQALADGAFQFVAVES